MSTAHKSAVLDTHPSANIGTVDIPSITPPATCPHIAERQEARRRQVLDTTVRLFFTKGYAGITMNGLCSAFGVTKPAVYCYFTDKYEIFGILCCEATQICLSATRETVNPAPPVRECLQACLLEMTRRCVDYHYAAALTCHDRQYLRPEIAEWLHGMPRDRYRDLYALLDEGGRVDVFGSGNTCVAAHSVGGVMGFMHT